MWHAIREAPSASATSRAERSKEMRSAGEGGTGIGSILELAAACRRSEVNAICATLIAPGKFIQIGARWARADDEV